MSVPYDYGNYEPEEPFSWDYEPDVDQCCAPDGSTEPGVCSCGPGCDCGCLNCPCDDDVRGEPPPRREHVITAPEEYL